MGKHSKGCLLALARGAVGVALVVAIACTGRGTTAAPAVHEGDGCMRLGQLARDVRGYDVTCVRETGSEMATWQRR